MRCLCIALSVFLAANSLAHGDIGVRIDDLSARLENAPRDAQLYAMRGDLHRQHEQWHAALSDYAMARRFDSTVEDLDYRQGRALLGLGEPDRARLLFDRHLASRPDDARVLIYRSRANAALGRWLEAAADLGRAQAASVNPAPDIFIERSRALLAAGPDHEAAAFDNLEDGVERLGPIVTLIRFAVTALRERDRHAEALVWIDRLPPAVTQQPVWLAEKADVMNSLNRQPEAATLYARALEAIDALPRARRDVPAMRAIVHRIRSR